MKSKYSVEVDKYDATALAHCLKRLEDGIPDFDYSWRIVINAGGIDYGIYLNIDTEKEEIEISNQPTYGSDGSDFIDDILENFNENEEE